MRSRSDGQRGLVHVAVRQEGLAAEPLAREPGAGCVASRVADGPTAAPTGPVQAMVSRFLAVRLVRYGLVSAVAIGVSQCVLALTFGLLRWDAVPANVLATGVATLPSYMLNRQWVWGLGGRSHVFREIVPFWVLAFLSLVASTAAAAFAASWAAMVTSDHRSRTLIVMAATLVAFGLLWVVRFLLMNRFMFAGSPTGSGETVAIEGSTAPVPRA
jgi:putative flippase GtrA